MAAYYDAAAAQEAEAAFDKQFKKHEIPDDVAEFAADLKISKISIGLPA